MRDRSGRAPKSRTIISCNRISAHAHNIYTAINAPPLDERTLTPVENDVDVQAVLLRRCVAGIRELVGRPRSMSLQESDPLQAALHETG